MLGRLPVRCCKFIVDDKLSELAGLFAKFLSDETQPGQEFLDFGSLLRLALGEFL